MEVADIRTQLKNKQLSIFYVFTGPELYVQKLYIQKIAECKNCSVVYADSVVDVTVKVKGRSIFNKPACYVVQEDSDFLKTETAWDRIKDVPQDNVLILQCHTIDKRSKFYKKFVDRIVVFDRLGCISFLK